MIPILGENLLALGFKREDDNSDEANPFHYYVYEIDDHALLISCASDEKKNGGYKVEFFELDACGTSDLAILADLIATIKRM